MAKVSNTVAGTTGCAEEADDEGVFLLEKRPVEIKTGIGVVLIEHHQYRRTAAEALNVAQPVFGPLVPPAVQHQHIEAAPGQEKLVGGMHDLLSAEVPKVAAELLIRGVQLPGLNPDSIGHGLIGIELLTPEAAGE